MRRLGGGEQETQTFIIAGVSVSTSLRYFSFFDVVEAGGIDGPRSFACGRPFRLLEVGVEINNDAGETIVGVHRNGSSTAEVSATASPGGTKVWMRHRFAKNFGIDEDLSISIDVTTTPGNIRGYIRVAYLD